MKWRLITCLILAFCIVLPSATVAAQDTDITGTVPLVVSEVSASNIGYYGATISWETNGNATSQVFYDTVSHVDVSGYADSTPESSTSPESLVTAHSIALTGLASGTTYHYRVRSRIPGGDTELITISDDYTFVTPTPPTGGGGGGLPTGVMAISLFGIQDSVKIDRTTGAIASAITMTSADGNLTVTLPAGTEALTRFGTPLTSLRANPVTPPSPPAGASVIGLAYDFGPDGATFDPPIEFKFTYDPATLPARATEKDLVIAYFDQATGSWVTLPCTVDTATNTITAQVSHFTIFTILAIPEPLAPAAFTVGDLAISPTTANVKETVTISTTISNTGDIAGSYYVKLTIDGVPIATKEITLAGGASQQMTFTASGDTAGTYSVDVNGKTGQFTVVAPPPPPPPPAPAAFSLSDLTIQPVEVQPKEAVVITVSVTNTGDIEGSYTVVLEVKEIVAPGITAEVNEVISRTSVTVAAGASEMVTFSVTREKAGIYSVDVDGLSGSFTVAAPTPPPPPPPTNWPLIGGILVFVGVVVGLVIFFLIRRRV